MPEAELSGRLAILIERTVRLHRLTARMSSAVHEGDIARLLLDESATALGAYSAAVWRVDERARQLVLVAATNYPDEALALVRNLPLERGRPISDAALTSEPVWLPSRAEYERLYPESSARTQAMAPTFYAVAALPIALGHQVLGALALTFLNEHVFDDDERMFLNMLALHCAQGFERARLHELETRARENAEFIANASALLSTSLDYEQTLQNIATLAVPGIGDWCGVDMVDAAGTIKQVAVAHVDPAKIEYARELRRRYPPDPAAKSGVLSVLRTGVSELYPDIPDELLVASAQDAEHLRISRELGLRSAMVVPIKDRNEVVGAISFVIADSPRRYTREDLRMAEQLGERAGAAIANASLYEQARAAVSLRDDFLAIAGHELRTPLAALTLHHQAVVQTRDGTPIDKIRERGSKMLAQTDRLNRLVDALLDVSRLTSGRFVLDLEDFDLCGLVREVIDRLHDDFDRAHCELRIDAAETLGRWDRSRLDQIVMNVLSNAIKYGKGAPIDVCVRRDGDAVTLVVVDRGIGIAAEDHARIFQRFERAVSPRNFGGLGLGLWITHQLVEAHGGSIRVDSRTGAGATFTITLPIAVPT